MPINVQGPDGQKYQFPDGTDPAVMKAAMAKRYPAGGKPPVNMADVPLPDFAPKKPVDIEGFDFNKDEGIVDIVRDRFNRQSEMADKFERQGLARRADEAGQEARSKAAASMGDVSPLVQAMTGSALDMAQQAGARGVYNEAGVMRPSDAFGVNILNAEGMGIPGFTSQTMRDQLRQSHSDQPVPAIAGEIAGSVIPGEGLYRGAKGLYGATLKPVITRALPKGGSLAAQGTRLATHGAEQVGIWAGQNAAFRGTTGASVDAAMEGRAPTFGDVVEGAREGATDPINMIGGAGGIGLSRVMRFVGSGGRTSVPADRADFVSSLSGRPSGSGTVLNAERFGDIDPLAEKQLVRLLGSRGYTRDDIAGALSAFEDASQGIVDDALLPARLKDIFVEHLGPGAAEPIDGFLQGAGNRSGTQGAATVQAGVAEDAGRLSQFVNDSAQNRFGAGSRYDTFQAAEQELGEIGKKYEQLFQPGAVVASPEKEQALNRVVAFYAGDKEMMKYVSAQARKMQMTPEEYIAQNPRRAAHMMQQAAREIADETPSKTIANAYNGIRDNILRPLEGATPGYRQTRTEFGDEIGFQKALTFAARFFTKAEDDIAIGKLAEEYQAMTPRQKDAAKLGIRDEALKFANRRTEGGSPRLSKIGNEPSLAALERVFGREGNEFANDLRATMDRTKRNQRISAGTGSNTMNKQEASAFAERAVSNPITRNIGNALQNMGGDAAISGATGFFSPVMTGRAMLRGLGNALAKGRQGKIDNLTDLLMRDAGGAPRRPMSGDGPLPTPTAAPVNALAEGAETGNPVPSRAPVSSAGIGSRSNSAPPVQLRPEDEVLSLNVRSPGPQASTPPSSTGASMHGGLRSDIGNALAGGAVGAFGPTDNPQDRIRNALIGAVGAPIVARAFPGRAAVETTPIADVFGTVAENAAERAAKVAADLAKVRRALSPPEAAAAERLQEPFARSVKSFIGDDMKPEYELAFLQEIRRASNGGRITEAQADRAAQSAFDKVKGMPRGSREVAGAGFTGKTPKIMKDVPIGTPKGPAKLSRTLKDVMKDEVPMQGIAKATGDEATMMDARAKEATAMLKGGKTAAEVYKATRLVPIEYKGGRIYIDSGDKTPDEVLSLFYQAVSLPRSQQPQWVRGVLDDLDPLVLENGKPPLLLDKPLAGGAKP